MSSLINTSEYDAQIHGHHMHKLMYKATILWFGFMIPYGPTNAQESLDRDVLDTIAKFAEEFCGDYWEGGSQDQINLSGSAKFQIEGIFRRLADLGAEGAANYDSEDYVGVLREHLSGELQDVRDCKMAIWDDLRTISSASGSENNNSVSASITGNYLMDNESHRRIIITHIQDNKFRIEEPTFKWPWSGSATLDGGKLIGHGAFRHTQAYMNVEGIVRGDRSIEVKYKFTTSGSGKRTTRVDSHVWYPID